MFDGFIHKQIKIQETIINLVQGGSGDPILLLHGYPQTHVCWHRVAPILAKRFTVVCPDLRGFGDSAKPPADPEHITYSKRVMAQNFDCGHFLPEEDPERTAAELIHFLS